MSIHKFSSTNHVPTARKQPPMSEQSSFPIHTPPYSDSDTRAFQRKGSLPLLPEVSDYVSPAPQYSAQDMPPPSSPGKLVQKYMEHMDVHPTQRKHRGSLSQSTLEHQGSSNFVQLSKATALVAPYVGDSTYKLPVSRFDDLEGSATLRAKPKMVSESPQVANSAIEHSSEKWRTLVETKDSLLAQKNHLIDRCS